MSIFAGLTPIEDQKPAKSNIFAGLTPVNTQEVASEDTKKENNSQPEKSGLLRKIKHLILGVTDIADLPNALSEVSKLQVNAARSMNPPVDWGNGVDFGEANIVEEAPRIPSLSNDILDPAIDKATGGLTAGEPDVGDTALRYASAMYSPAKLASMAGSKAANKAASVISSKRPVDVAGAAAMGVTTQALEDSGVNEGTSAVAGLGASVIPSLLTRKGKGSTPNYVDKESLKAIEDAGVESYRKQWDKRKRTQIAHTFGEHSIFGAKTLNNQDKKVATSYKKQIEKEMDKTSTSVTPEKQALKEQLYNESEGLLTQDHNISAENTRKSFESARQIIKNKALVGEDEAKLLARVDALESKINGDVLSEIVDASGKKISKSDMGDLTSTLSKSKFSSGSWLLNPENKSNNTLVKTLLDRKRQLNEEIGGIFGSKKVDYNLAEVLKEINSGIKKDINEFAQKNPKNFGEKWFEAEKLHGSMASRLEFNHYLGLKNEYLKPWRDYSPEKIIENYMNARTKSGFQKLIGGKDNLKNWDKFVPIAATLPDSKVSTLAKNMKIMGLIGVATGLATGTLPIQETSYAAGTGLLIDAYVARFLKSKKAINKMTIFTKNPTPENAKKFNNTLKAETGLSARELMARIESNQGDSDKKDKDKTQAKVTFKGSPGTEFIV